MLCIFVFTSARFVIQGLAKKPPLFELVTLRIVFVWGGGVLFTDVERISNDSGILAIFTFQ